MEEFKGNSDASKSTPSERRVITPVTTNVVEKKTNGIGKIKNRMFSEDAGSVGESVVSDVIIPKVQDLIVGAFKYMIDYVFYGKAGASSASKRSGIGTVSYSNYYRPNGGSQPMPQLPMTAYARPNTIYQIKDILFNDRAEAEEVILAMQDTIIRYGSVTVGDFYDMIGQHGTYTDQKYGWRDLSQTSPVRYGGGWRIDFPKVTPID